jgi:hypothetical protein
MPVRSRPRVVRRRAVSIVRAPGRPEGDRLRRVESWSQVSQGFATVVALLLAVPGVIFTMSTYRDQQTLNRDQRILNREQQTLNGMAVARNDRRYASRVSFWDVDTYTDKPDPREHVTLVMVRNMAPLPITDVVLLGAPSIGGSLPSLRPETDGVAGYRPVVQVRTIPPCHEMKVWVQRRDLYGAWLRMFRPHARELAITEIPTWTSATMSFVVAGRTWEVTTPSLELRPARGYAERWSDAEVAAARIGAEASTKSAPISDCGEGG